MKLVFAFEISRKNKNVQSIDFDYRTKSKSFIDDKGQKIRFFSFEKTSKLNSIETYDGPSTTYFIYLAFKDRLLHGL